MLKLKRLNVPRGMTQMKGDYSLIQLLIPKDESTIKSILGN